MTLLAHLHALFLLPHDGLVLAMIDYGYHILTCVLTIMTFGQVVRGYKAELFREDLKKLYERAGLNGENTVFLFNDTQVSLPIGGWLLFADAG